jgi:pimeloyl-[acyl-carrier protein] methyl ester esterase
MPEQLVLLPGWSFGAAALEPLRAALVSAAPGLQVSLWPLPQQAEPTAWLDELDQRLPADSWLVGWSLGGMLATQLAARRGDGCRGLATLASNPCFRAREVWPSAMPAAVFDSFRAGFVENPQQTLARFSLLCSRGSTDPRGLARQLQDAQLERPVAELDAGLQLLADLDGRAALHRYSGPQLHLFAARDALVPATAAEALAGHVPQASVQVLADASHALALERPDEVATAILAFVREHDHD